MNKKLLCVLLFVPSVTFAGVECHYEHKMTSVTASKVKIINTKNIMYATSKISKTCRTTIRGEYKGKIVNLLGEATGDINKSDEMICNEAMHNGIHEFEAISDGAVLNSNEVEVCTDDTSTVHDVVYIGDIIKETDVRAHPSRPPFYLNNVPCKWFTEQTVKPTDMYVWTGVICKNNGTDKWTVIDKY